MLKSPVWKDEVGVYFFTGGLAGASAMLALAARVSGQPRLARTARLVGLAGAAASPPLLIADLARPERFLHMLRVFKPTSPMSIGTWVLSAFSGASLVGNLCAFSGKVRPLGAFADVASALLGLPLSTYTAVLLADTAVPVWYEAQSYLPFVFAAGAAASAGATACLLTPPAETSVARRLAVAGALGELAAANAMERRLGLLAQPYKNGKAARPSQLAKAFVAFGAATLAAAGRSRTGTVLGSLAVLIGSVAQRLAVLHAGRESAEAAF